MPNSNSTQQSLVLPQGALGGGTGVKRKLIKLLLSSGDRCGQRRVYDHNLMYIFVITLWILISHLV